MTKTPEGCQYAVLQGVIHVFTLYPMKAAIDCHFDILEDVFANHPPDTTIYLLFKIPNANQLPARYLVNKATKFWGKQRIDFSIRAAYVHDGNIILTLFDQFVRTLRLKSTRAFFTHDQLEMAIDWLLEDENTRVQARPS